MHHLSSIKCLIGATAILSGNVRAMQHQNKWELYVKVPTQMLKDIWARVKETEKLSDMMFPVYITEGSKGKAEGGGQLEVDTGMCNFRATKSSKMNGCFELYRGLGNSVPATSRHRVYPKYGKHITCSREQLEELLNSEAHILMGVSVLADKKRNAKAQLEEMLPGCEVCNGRPRLAQVNADEILSISSEPRSDASFVRSEMERLNDSQIPEEKQSGEAATCRSNDSQSSIFSFTIDVNERTPPKPSKKRAKKTIIPDGYFGCRVNHYEESASWMGAAIMKYDLKTQCFEVVMNHKNEDSKVTKTFPFVAAADESNIDKVELANELTLTLSDDTFLCFSMDNVYGYMRIDGLLTN